MPRGREREYTYYLSQWLRGANTVSHTRKRENFGKKHKTRNNTGTLLLCAQGNLSGESLSANAYAKSAVSASVDLKKHGDSEAHIPYVIQP